MPHIRLYHSDCFYVEIKSENDWEKLVADFIDNATKFAGSVEQIEDHIFEEPYVDEK